MIIELKNKQKVEIKDELTWGDSEYIDNITQGATSLVTKGTNQEDIEKNLGISFNPEALLKAKYATIEKAIVKIEDEDGKEIKYSKEWLDNLSVSDGNKVYESAQELLKKK